MQGANIVIAEASVAAALPAGAASDLDNSEQPHGWVIKQPRGAGAGRVETWPRDPHCLMRTYVRRELP
jgi:hypothetical protein